MFVEVPEPVWKMSTTNASSNSPSMTRYAGVKYDFGTIAVEFTEFEVDFGRAQFHLSDCSR